MSLEAIKALNIRDVIEMETGLSFKRQTLQHCPFCDSGNHGHRGSDSAFRIKEAINDSYFYCFSCGTGGSVLDFIMKYYELGVRDAIKYAEEKYLKFKAGADKFMSPKKALIKMTEAPVPEYIPTKWIDKSMKTGKNNLTNWLINRYGKEQAEQAIKKYKVGSSRKWEEATVFFNIDEKGLVRRGKIMLYDTATGKRNRNMNPTSVHSVMKLKERPESCLFGLHLRDTHKEKVIAIVESEKTAIIMSIICPDYLWMATGGLSFLHAKYFKALNSRSILLFPDLGEPTKFGTPYEQWKRKLPEIWKVVMCAEISDLLEKQGTPDQRKKGFDIADYFVNMDAE